MPVKFKKGSKEAKARMAKIRAMRGTSTHKDTKSHNVNIKVVSGAVGSLPFTGKILGVNISAKNYENGIEIITGINRNLYFPKDLKAPLIKILIGSIASQRTVKEYDPKKLAQTVKNFVDTLKNEFSKSVVKKNKVITPVKKKTKTTKKTVIKSKDSFRQTGASNKAKDETRKALPAGKRKSASGKTYYERRANRSDKPGSLLGIKSGANSTQMSLRQISANNESIDRLTRFLFETKEKIKYWPYNTPFYKNLYNQKIKEVSAYIKTLKKQNTELKKHIK
jgi:hypothetical protein